MQSFIEDDGWLTLCRLVFDFSVTEGFVEKNFQNH